MPRYPKRWHHRYDGILRYTVEHPAARRTEIAQATGFCVSTVSRVMNWPVFRARFKTISDAVVREILREQLRPRRGRRPKED